MAVSGNLGLGLDDIGYACMPLFHSNAHLPRLPARLPRRRQPRAARALQRVELRARRAPPRRHVLELRRRAGALRARRASRRSTAATWSASSPRSRGNPQNRLRYALGNGAAAPDIERFTHWLGLEDMFELYGSTEAAISTFRKKGDPRGSRRRDHRRRREDPERARRGVPARRARRPTARSPTTPTRSGEICRVAPDTGLFQGYFDNPDANASKYRDGVYHSGDLGHVLVRDGTRYLFFDGRTDDWIRKDGENFSALQVARLVQEHPDVVLAAAYGVPCAVSDELVMAALKLRAGATLRPEGLLRLLRAAGDRRRHGPQVVPRLRPRRRRVRVHADGEDPGAQPEAGALRPPPAAATSRSSGAAAATRPTGRSRPPTTRRCAHEFAAAEKLDLLDR